MESKKVDREGARERKRESGERVESKKVEREGEREREREIER